jgi:hypothetical protein
MDIFKNVQNPIPFLLLEKNVLLKNGAEKYEIFCYDK